MNIKLGCSNYLSKKSKLNFNGDEVDYTKLGGFLIDYYQGKATVQDGRIVPSRKIAPIATSGPVIHNLACADGEDLVKLHSGMEQSLRRRTPIPQQLTPMVGYDVYAPAIATLNKGKMPINPYSSYDFSQNYPDASISRAIAVQSSMPEIATASAKDPVRDNLNAILKTTYGVELPPVQPTSVNLPRKIRNDIVAEIGDIAVTTSRKFDYPAVEMVQNVVPLVYEYEPAKVDIVERNLKQNLPKGSILVLGDGEINPDAHACFTPDKRERMQRFASSLAECYQPIHDLAISPNSQSHVLVKVK